MRVTLDLHDDLAESYRREADDRCLPIESVLEGRLVSGTALDPRNRSVIVVGDPLRSLEATLGLGAIQSATDLATRVGRLGVIQFGAHEIRLTPGQMEEIAWRARKRGRTVEEIVQEAYVAFAEGFFDLIPGVR